MSRLAMADELLILALCASADGWTIGQGGRVRIPPYLDLGLAAAELAGHGPRPGLPQQIIGVAAGRPHLRRIAALREQGRVVVRELPPRGLFQCRTVTRLSTPEYGAEYAIMDRLIAALRGLPADDDTIGLLAVMRACDLHRQWFRDLPRRERARRIDRLTRDHWLRVAVESAIAADLAWPAAANGTL
ncbi:GPP34 family phosphoprotein [Nonomuraea sp. MCN248]|uniref:GPP34 family phosphoprotein n=1 Tax=Nonomuraea corallina TaxID=2989783 RepID=A0ABT4SAI4_9ACTN|nr:GPP34 family phosphoprotein [Nonomuraea corallina]MDA0634223.1 GPP34 family phosphoprotein [Nonomuraea corallina]